jgi:L-lactate dehydrogenase complex protein LldG
MKATITNKEIVLRKVREASYKEYERDFSSLDFDSEVFAVSKDNALVSFAEELIKVGGKFVYCMDEKDMSIKLSALLDDNEWYNPLVQSHELGAFFQEEDLLFQASNLAPVDTKVGITSCEYLIGRLGSVMISSWSGPGRMMHAYPEIHIVIAKANQVVMTIGEAITLLRKKYAVDFPSEVTMITGPSRTADIEKTLVMGAHGPKELIVFVMAK